MKISFSTIGCKLNQAETEDLKSELLEKGFNIVPFDKQADVSVIRACGITADASRTTREIIRQAKRRGAYVIAVGCLENKNLPEIDFVAKNNEEVLCHAELVSASHGILKQVQNDEKSVLTKTRAFIKIQTGCDYNCAYCVIPSFRGRPQSVPAEEIISKIKKAEKNGCKEIVLTGVNICLYRSPVIPSIKRGRPSETARGVLAPTPPEPPCGSPSLIGGSIDLARLLKKILKETKIPRIRLGSLDPRLISKELTNLYLQNNKRLMPHWHLSLQSGSDKILKQMNRHYTSRKYLAIVESLRKKSPNFSFTTDIIVGFPGETEDDFNETCQLVAKAQFLKTHIFQFSPRKGTKAEKMPNQISDKTKKDRAARLAVIAKKTSENFIKKIIGKTRPVLFEQKKSNFYSGYTPEYIRVKLKSAAPKKIKNIKITSSLLADQ